MLGISRRRQVRETELVADLDQSHARLEQAVLQEETAKVAAAYDQLIRALERAQETMPEAKDLLAEVRAERDDFVRRGR